MLGRGALESDGEVVSLNVAAVQCDVRRFEALVREGSSDALSAAVDLYRGDETASEKARRQVALEPLPYYTTPRLRAMAPAAATCCKGLTAIGCIRFAETAR